YQAEFKGFVPVLYNWHTSGSNNHVPKAPARTCMPSVSFRAYDKGSKNIAKVPDGNGGTFDPNINWFEPAGNNEKRQAYEDNLMPDYYVCPFSRGKGPGWMPGGNIKIEGNHGSVTYSLSDWKGMHETYHPWKWEGNIRRGRLPVCHTHPDGQLWPHDQCGDLPGDDFCMTQGRPKYSVLSWSMVRPDNDHYPAPPDFIPLSKGSGKTSGEKNLDNRHRKWTSSDAQFVNVASLSDVTVLFCVQGKTLGLNDHMSNIDSHRSSLGGGTNIVFADSHVEWVVGTQVGWE
ncbi:MAG: hypothetical protein ACYTF1_09835, partial [Planctomycetota bacterium]